MRHRLIVEELCYRALREAPRAAIFHRRQAMLSRKHVDMCRLAAQQSGKLLGGDRWHQRYCHDRESLSLKYRSGTAVANGAPSSVAAPLIVLTPSVTGCGDLSRPLPAGNVLYSAAFGAMDGATMRPR